MKHLATVAGVLVIGVVVALLARPLWYSLRADKISTELGIHPATDARARLVDSHVLAAVESRAFGRELRLRLGHPARRVSLSGFAIDRCEVRQIDFERFARWRQAQPNLAAAEAADLVSISSGHRIAGLLTSPATGVSFGGAARYCAALGGRLPWAEEFEAAAAGANGRLYAWGDDFDAESWPYLDGWHNAARACGAYPPAATPRGVQDLTSNAMEWSAGSRTAPPPRQPAAHGAPAVRARGRELYALNAAWLNLPPTTRSHHLGFRCVYAQAAAPPPWGGAAPTVIAIPGGEYPLGLPPAVRLARLAVLLPNAQLRGLRTLLAADNAAGDQIKVSRCEVSRGEYQAFLDDPLARLGLFANPQQPADEQYIPDDWTRQLSDAELPVTGVSWWAADAFARWAGGRLPRAREWRLLAAGREARIYPWGNEYDAAAAVTADLPQPGPRACTAGLRDVSAAGVHHLAGNVSEWTQSINALRGNYAMWVQGGNWVLPGVETARSSFGRLVPLNHRSAGIGLRVVYD